jgi:hypothetical protein
MQTGYSAVPSANANKVRGAWLNSEYDRLREADQAGIRHRIWARNMEHKQNMLNASNELAKQRLGLKADANRIAMDQLEDSKTGALIGNLINVAGIAYNRSEQAAQRDLDFKTLQNQAGERMIKTEAIKDQGGTLSQADERQYGEDWATVHSTDANPEPNYDDDGTSPGIIQRIRNLF